MFLSVIAKNDSPVATDDRFELLETGAINGSLTANDVDIDGDDYQVTLIEPPTHGELTLRPDGSFTYEHNGSEEITDKFSYRISDGDISDIGEVSLTIIPVNDVPVAKEIPAQVVQTESITLIRLPDNLFTDSDNGDELEITLTAVDGGDAPSWLSFDPDTARAFHDEYLDVDTDFCAMCGHDWCSVRISKEIVQFTSGKSADYQWDKAKISEALTDDQKEILEKRGVLSPSEIHKLASKTKSKMAADADDKASCHSDFVDDETARELQQKNELPVIQP